MIADYAVRQVIWKLFARAVFQEYEIKWVDGTPFLVIFLMEQKNQSHTFIRLRPKRGDDDCPDCCR